MITKKRITESEYKARVDELTDLREKARWDKTISLETSKYIMHYTSERLDDVHAEWFGRKQ
jgi:predicted RNase H-related nuclease YkuK (DUF458 family)